MDSEKKKILIVDDDNFLLDMYVFKFNQNNFEVYPARDGVQAIEKLKQGLEPDVILLDVIMPNMDGFEMLENMQTEKLAQNAVKIILSNKGQQEEVQKGKSLGASDYIIKVNSTPAEVIERVKKILEAKNNKEKENGL